jgi:hypothetical protein
VVAPEQEGVVFDGFEEGEVVEFPQGKLASFFV